MSRRLLFGCLLIVLVALPGAAVAQVPLPNILVTLAPLNRQTGVELSALTVDANIAERDGHTFAEGVAEWKVHNTDPLNETTIVVGFPEWASASASFDPTKFNAFRVLVDNEAVVLAPQTADVIYGDASKTINWYTFEITLAPDEKKNIVNEFSQDLGTDPFPRFTYGMLVGNRWKNAVGSARISVKLPEQTQGEQFVSLDPSVPDFDGETLTWLWTDLNPEADPGVTFIKPSQWQTLLARRAAVAKNPDDPAAHLELGRLYQQFAAVESARRPNFLAQAVAELETAARLAPDNADAVKTLAALYEQRAGAPTGPRETNYVSLAMAQWQKLFGTASDAEARKQLAEDSFYLALAATTSGDYARALKLLDDARTFSPEGAGPLYTPDRYQNQVKVTHLAAAQADISAGAVANAFAHLRTVYGDGFQPALNLPTEMLALNHARIQTGLNQRRIVLDLIPYPAPSEGVQNDVAQVVTALNATGAGTAELTPGAGGYTLTLTVPFTGDADLRNRLVKLGAVLPTRADWSLVRAALVPPQLELTTDDGVISHRVHYREQVDWGNGQQQIQATLNDMSARIGELSTASTDDPEAQVKLKLLTHAQQWWFQQLGALTTEYSLDAGDGAAQRWSISLGAPRTLEYDADAVRGIWYAVGIAVALGILLLAIVGFVTNRRRRHA